MKKIFTIIPMLILSVCLFHEARSQNLVTNSGFEFGTSPWELENWAGNTATTDRTMDTAHSGSYCQRVKLTAIAPGSQAGVYLSFKQLQAKPGMPLLVKCWIRGKDNAKAEILIRQGTTPGAVYYRHRFTIRSFWQEYSFRAIMPDNVDTANTRLSIQLNEVGHFALDDITVNNSSLIANPGFETGTGTWQFTANPAGSGGYNLDSTDKHYGNYSTRLQLNSAGGVVSYVYPNLQVKPNMPVRIDFWARGLASGKKVKVSLQKGTAPYSIYYQTTLTMSTAWKAYSCLTMMPDTTDSNVQLQLQLSDTGTVILDDVAVSDVNMITNPGFEAGTTPWLLDNWAGNTVSSARETTNPHSGSWCMKVNMTAIATNPSVLYTYPRIPLKPNMPVQIRFWARGVSNSPAVTVFIRQSVAPYQSYLRNEISVTDEWQEYVFTSVMPSTIDSANMQLIFQLANVGFLVIDDVTIMPMPDKEGGDIPTVSPIRNGSFEAGRDGWSGTIRQREFGTRPLESGSLIPCPDNADLLIRSDGAIDKRKYMRVPVNRDCWGYVTSAYFKARYGQPVTLSCYVRSDSTRLFSMGYGRGKNNAYASQGAQKTATTSWTRYTQKYVLPPAEGGVYTFIFLFEQTGGWFDIDGVAIVEDSAISPTLFTKAVAIEAASGTPAGNLFDLNQTAGFRLLTAGDVASSAISYSVRVLDYKENVVYTGSIASLTDTGGYGDTAFIVPTTSYGGFRIELRKTGSDTLLAEQLYSVLPPLPDPATRPNSFFGAHTDFTTYNLLLAKRGGFRWLRTWGPLMTTWIAAEPAPGVWNFPTARIAKADSMGFKIMGMLGTAPVFRADTATGDGASNRWSRSYPPKNIGDWKQYIVRTHSAYNSYVDAWELWNEPDGNYMMVKAGQSKPVVYNNLLTAARQVFDSLSVTQPLIGPAMANINDSIGWQILNQGGNSKLDAFSFHLYNISSGGASPDVNYLTPVLNGLHSYLNKTNDSMPLWHTEGGPYLSGGRSWLATYNVPPTSSVTLPQAAAVMVRSALYLKAKGVKKYFDFTIDASPTGRRIDVDMIAPYIDVTGIPTPAFAAHAAMVAITEDANPVGFYTLSGTAGVKQASFQDSAGNYIHVFWSNTPVLLSSVATVNAGDQVKDIMGNLLNATTATISEFPVYLVRGTGMARMAKTTEESTINVYPNPVMGRTVLSHPVLSYTTQAYVITTSGQVVKRMTIQPGVATTPLELGSLPQGVYLVQYFGKKPQAIKFIR